jgi:nucleotide-binding universal stress UspA family protein
MYKHILIPLEDSKLAAKAIKSGVALARSLKARVTGFTALPAYELPSEAELMSRRAISPAEHDKRSRAKAKQILSRLQRSAAKAGVSCDTAFTLSDRPDEAIVEAAGEHGCDLILMVSHGRSGLSALLNGSQTRGVLAKAKIPTLVYR